MVHRTAREQLERACDKLDSWEKKEHGAGLSCETGTGHISVEPSMGEGRMLRTSSEKAPQDQEIEAQGVINNPRHATVQVETEEICIRGEGNSTVCLTPEEG